MSRGGPRSKEILNKHKHTPNPNLLYTMQKVALNPPYSKDKPAPETPMNPVQIKPTPTLHQPTSPSRNQDKTDTKFTLSGYSSRSNATRAGRCHTLFSGSNILFLTRAWWYCLLSTTWVCDMPPPVSRDISNRFLTHTLTWPFVFWWSLAEPLGTMRVCSYGQDAPLTRRIVS